MEWQGEWVQRIRTAVHIGEEFVLIPHEFWRDIRPGDLNLTTSRVSRHHEKRLWKMLGRTGPCPKRLPIVINTQDVKSRQILRGEA